MADIILVAALFIFVRIGAKKGLIRTLFGAISTLLSLFLTVLIYQPFSQMLHNSAVGDYVRNLVEKSFEQKIQEGAIIPLLNEVTKSTSTIIINIISFIIIIIATRLILSILSRVLNIASKLPLIKQLNSILGMIAGAVSGFLFCYIIIGIIGALNGEGSISIMQKSIENSYIAIKMYENNFVSNMLLSYFH